MHVHTEYAHMCMSIWGYSYCGVQASSAVISIVKYRVNTDNCGFRRNMLILVGFWEAYEVGILIDLTTYTCSHTPKNNNIILKHVLKLLVLV